MTWWPMPRTQTTDPKSSCAPRRTGMSRLYISGVAIRCTCRNHTIVFSVPEASGCVELGEMGAAGSDPVNGI